MKLNYIDIHCHLQEPQFDADRGVLVQKMRDTGVGGIVVGVDEKTSQQAVALAEAHENLWAVVGQHPTDDDPVSFNEDWIRELLTSTQVVAIGECGFDFYHADRHEALTTQEKLFRHQIELALHYDLPLMLHVRDQVEQHGAYEEALRVLAEYKDKHGEKLRGNVHFFASTLDIARRFVEIGFTTSFTGLITFNTEWDEVIRNIPLTSIMAETDAPFVAPEPYRGQRNEPGYVRYVYKKIADLRGEDPEVVRAQIVQNASTLFGIEV